MHPLKWMVTFHPPSNRFRIATTTNQACDDPPLTYDSSVGMKKFKEAQPFDQILLCVRLLFQ